MANDALVEDIDQGYDIERDTDQRLRLTPEESYGGAVLDYLRRHKK